MTDGPRPLYDLVARALAEEPSRRRGVIEGGCGGDAALRDEALRIVGIQRTLGDFLEKPAPARLDLLSAPQPPLPPGTTVGRYRLERVLGSGGSGTVYEALQESPQRRVALKVMAAGLGSTGSVRRFRDEAEILAQLNHPGVAHVYEAGVHGTLPWLALEYVDGAQDVVGRARGLAIRERVDLMARICDAVHHGHSQGILHGDLKPTNLLVDPNGTPKVIDFGIARVLGGDADAEVAGTPAYMSPELCAPGPRRPDVRSDVYALGAVLYEVLAGKRAHAVTDLPLADALRAVAERAPARLETGGDLAAIVGKALARAPDARYASVAALADDLRRHLAHEPVLACTPSTAYRARKFVHRNPALTAAFLAIVGISVAAAAVSIREARATERALRRAEYRGYVASIAVADGAVRAGDAAAAGRALQDAPERYRGWEWHLLASRVDVSRVIGRGPGGGGIEARFMPGEARILGVSNNPSVAGGYVCLWDAATGVEIARTKALPAFADAPVASPDGCWAAWAVGHDIAFCDDMREYRILRQHAKVNDLEFHPGGGLLAASVGAEVLWLEVPDGHVVARFDAGAEEALCLAFDATGDLMVAGSADGMVRVWRPADGGVPVTAALPSSVRAVAVRADRVAAASSDGTLRCWTLAEDRLDLTLHSRGSRSASVALSPDGSLLASGHVDGSIALWDAATGDRRAALVGHEHGILTLEFSADGSRLLSSSFDGTWRTWDAVPANDTLGTHDKLVRSLAFRPDGTELAAASFDGSLRVYDVASREATLELPLCPTIVQCVSWLPGGDRICAGTGDGRVFIVDPRRGEIVTEWNAHTRAVLSVAPDPGGRWIASGGVDGLLQVFDAATREQVFREAGASWAWAAAFSPDGSLLAASGTDHGTNASRVRLFRGGSWETVRDLPHPAPVLSLAFNALGTLLATASSDAMVRLWDVRGGACRFTMPCLRSSPQSVVFSPDGARLAVAAGPDTEIWDPATGERLLTLRGNGAALYAVAFRPDGRMLVAGGGDSGGAGSAILVWNPVPSTGSD